MVGKKGNARSKYTPSGNKRSVLVPVTVYAKGDNRPNIGQPNAILIIKGG
jgi:hypothetical protein